MGHYHQHGNIGEVLLSIEEKNQELKEKYKAKNLEQVFLSITGRRMMEGI